MKLKLLLLLCVFMMIIGCSSENLNEVNNNEQNSIQTSQGTEKTNSDSSDDEAMPVFDESLKEEHTVSSETSTVITFPCGDNARLDIAFLEGSVESDRTFEVSPIKSSSIGKDNYAGFYLSEKDATGSVEINSPAAICYMTTEEIPDDVRIVKFGENDEDDYIVPGYRVKTKDGNGLIAFVDSFSGYGVKKVSKIQIERMADTLQEVGFNWVLDVDDHYKIMHVDGTEMMLQCRIGMVNTTAPCYSSIAGTYKGEVKLGLYGAKDVGLEIEGFNLPLAFGLMYGDNNASFELYPILKEYDTLLGSDVPIVGLVPQGYAGKGTLQLVLDDVGFMGSLNDSEDAEPNPAPFTVITRGPIAYVNVNYYGVGYMKFQGSIVGHAKKTEEQLPTPMGEIELVPLTGDVPFSEHNPDDNTVDLNNDDKPDASIEASFDSYLANEPDDVVKYDNDGDGKTDVTIKKEDDGGIGYDMNGDGETDITIYPLI